MNCPQTRTKLSSHHGFTLLEVLVALALLSIVAAAMAPSFVGQLLTNKRAEVRTEAIAVAQRVLDNLRVVDPTSLPTSGSDDPISIQGGEKPFEAVISYCITAEYCTARSRHLTVTVSYREEQVYEVETVFTRLR